MRLISRFRTRAKEALRDRGQTTLEYFLLVGAVGILAAGLIFSFGGKISGQANSAGACQAAITTGIATSVTSACP